MKRSVEKKAYSVQFTPYPVNHVLPCGLLTTLLNLLLDNLILLVITLLSMVPIISASNTMHYHQHHLYNPTNTHRSLQSLQILLHTIQLEQLPIVLGGICQEFIEAHSCLGTPVKLFVHKVRRVHLMILVGENVPIGSCFCLVAKSGVQCRSKRIALYLTRKSVE